MPLNVAPRTLVIVRNPISRRAPSPAVLLRDAVDALMPADWGVDIQTSEAPGHATVLAAAAARAGVDVVAACGGDGTVSEVANGLAGTRTALAVIPAGTADVWAREAHIPRHVGSAFRTLVDARKVRVDLGRVDFASGQTRRFLLMCGVGLDGEVVRRVGLGGWRKRLAGQAYYAAVGASVLLRAVPEGAVVDIDELRLEGPLLQAVIGNTRLYGGVTRLTCGARVDDGLLDVCTFAGDGLMHRFGLVARALRGRLDARAGGGIDYRRGARIAIASEWPLPVQADGEFIGETPISITVERGALLAMIGQQPNELLTRG